MNILRLIGLIGHQGLLGPDAPVRHAAKRTRLKTMIQESIDRAGQLISTGRKLILGLGANDRSAKAFARLHGELFVASTCSSPMELALLGCLSLTAGKGLPVLAARQRPGQHSTRRMLVQPTEL